MAPWIVWTLLTLLAWGIWAVLYKSLTAVFPMRKSKRYQRSAYCQCWRAVCDKDRGPQQSPSRNPNSTRIGHHLVLGQHRFLQRAQSRRQSGRGDSRHRSCIRPSQCCWPLLLAEGEIELASDGWESDCLFGAIYLFHVSQEQSLLSPWLLMALIPIVLWGICGLMQKMATNDISGRILRILVSRRVSPCRRGNRRRRSASICHPDRQLENRRGYWLHVGARQSHRIACFRQRRKSFDHRTAWQVFIH